MDIFYGFGERLNTAMKIKGITNSQITEELGLSKNAIGNYKNNNLPRADILYAISQKIGVSMEWLLTGKENTADLTTDEQQLLADFRSCSLEIQNVIRAAAASGAVAPDTAASAQIQSGNLSSSKTG